MRLLLQVPTHPNFQNTIFPFVWSSLVHGIRPKTRRTQSFLCVCAFPPACLWWVGVFGPSVLPPCWRKRAAPLTMKKLSLRLEDTQVENNLRMNTWHQRAVIFYSVVQLMLVFHQFNQNRISRPSKLRSLNQQMNRLSTCDALPVADPAESPWF